MHNQEVHCVGPEWKAVPELLQAQAPENETRGLRDVLLTTYDPPDSGVLVEDLLPEWLGLERGFGDKATGNQYLFFSELDRALKRNKGKLNVFCSNNGPGEEARQPYPWIFRYVRCFRVGKNAPAVQHAKLWLFHWADEETQEETLEIVISSCNLTRDGLRNQIQAGWKAVAQVGRSSQARLQGWGILPDFLRELARASAGDSLRPIERWIKLLARAEPPADVRFLASVPGRHHQSELRSTPWGMVGLQQAVTWSKARVDIIAPNVGDWDSDGIKKWANQIPRCQGIGLVWPPKPEKACQLRGRSLSFATWGALKKAGVELLAWPAEYETTWRSLLHPEHRESDGRWPHCKMYWFSHPNRRDTTLLVTSANFSKAAWGKWERSQLKKPRLVIENFELGVAFAASENPLRRLKVMEGEPHLGPGERTRLNPAICWADAMWNGRRLTIGIRLKVRIEPRQIHMTLTLDGNREVELKRLRLRRSGKLHQGHIRWTAREGIPASVELEFKSRKTRETLVIAVADTRPVKASWETPCPEIPREFRDNLELRLVLEQYGGEPADETNGPTGPGGGSKVQGKPADFRVEVIEEARQNWEVLDNWKTMLKEADGAAFRSILRDGRILRSHWKEKAAGKGNGASALAAELAADECEFRIRRASK